MDKAKAYKERRHLAEAYRHFARLHTFRGDLPAAHTSLAEAIDLFERLGMRRELAEAREERARPEQMLFTVYLLSRCRRAGMVRDGCGKLQRRGSELLWENQFSLRLAPARLGWTLSCSRFAATFSLRRRYSAMHPQKLGKRRGHGTLKHQRFSRPRCSAATSSIDS